MITYTQGNLLGSPTQALVNTVNEVGVMGKGIALMFREAFPESARAYESACREGKVRVGKMFVTKERDLAGDRWIIHFPTKKHWRHPSRLEWIREGLKDLARVIRELDIHSLSLPPLGCGNGGLEWSQVRKEIEVALSGMDDVDIRVFAPIDAYQNASKREGVEELTPARALMADLVRRYSVLGLECTNLEVQKLAWFLHRVTQKLNLPDMMHLRYAPNRYGPYADNLRHLLNGLDGSYLHCEKRLSDAGPLDQLWFEDIRRDVVESYLKQHCAQYLPALEETAALIDGFESPLGMELLATVDWLIGSGHQATIEGVKKGLSQWPGGVSAGKRKLKLFDDRMLSLALDRLALANLGPILST